MRSIVKASIFLGCMASVLPIAGQAQNTDVFEEIVVTATRRAESIQDVPIAVTALNSGQLERSGVRDVRDLTRLAPSLNVSNSQSASSTRLRIRGVGTTGNNAGLESAVGVFLDGVYLSRPDIALSDLLDVQQIEVLRGPQGTLFGRNTSAGALTITTKKPNLEETEAYTNVTVGNHNLQNVQAGFTTPLTEGVSGIRVAGAYRKRDGTVNSVTGAESNTKDRVAVKGQYYYEPSDTFSFRLLADYSDVEEQCCDAVVIKETPVAAVYPLAGLPVGGGVSASGDSAFESRTSNSEQFDNPFSQYGLSAELVWSIGESELTYIPAYRDFESVSVQQSDFVNLDVFSTRTEGNNESSSHELRLQGAAFDDRVDWMIGAYYSEEEISSRQRVEAGQDYQRYAGSLLLAGGVRAFGPNPLGFLAQGRSATGNFADNLFTQDSTSFSIFTHNIISLSDNVDLTLGARYVDESKDGAFNQLDANSPACIGTLTNPAFGVPQLAPLRGNAIALNCFPFTTQANIPGSPITPVTYQDKFEDDELVYTIKLGYVISDYVNGYAGFTHGFKSGGFNLDSTAAIGGVDPTFRSEKIDNYEIGFKSTLLDGSLTANVAFFHQEIEDLQILEFTGIQFSTFNVPLGESTGVEIESQWHASDSLTLNASLTYADASYPENCADGIQSTPAIALRAANLCGAQFTNAPEYVAVLGGRYETQVNDNWMLSFNTDARYESDRRTSTQPSNFRTGTPSFGDIQDSFVIANARVGLSSDDGKWSFELWANNLFDERSKTVTFNLPLRGSGDSAARGVFLSEPRTYGATLRWNY